jgi:hypothetical protein
VFFIPKRHLGRFGGQSVKRGSTYESEGSVGQNGYDVGAGVDKPATDLNRLIGSDPTAYSEYDPPAVKRAHVSRPEGSGTLVVGFGVD